MHSLAERVLSHIRRQDLLNGGDRVGVAVSGGIDSVALLRLLLELRHELGIVVSVVHFNHKLRANESDADQEFVAKLAREYDLEFHVDGEDVARHAAEEQVSVETAARELRYGFFRYLLGGEGEDSPSGAEAQGPNEFADRSAESAAPPKNGAQGLKPGAQGLRPSPQGLEPDPFVAANGTAEAVPFPNPSFPNPSFPNSSIDGAAGSRDLLNQTPARPEPVSAPLNPASASLHRIATGHTLDDQAETVLMRMIRGAGLRGLGGIYPRILVADDDGEGSGEIVRPLLAVRRRELERYLKDIGQPWREDSSNTDAHFTRNRVRKLVLPLLEQEFNPAVAGNLAELAEIARGEEDYWENEVSGWLGTTVQWSQPDWARVGSGTDGLVQIAGCGIAPEESGSVKSPTSRAKSAREMGHPAKSAREMGHPEIDLRSTIDEAPWLVMNASVNRMWFLGEPLAVQRRLVKAIGENAGIPLEFKHVEKILRVAAEDGASGKELSLPLGWKLVLEPEELRFLTPDLRGAFPLQHYEYELPVPGRVKVYEAGSSIEVRRVPDGAQAGYNPDQLLEVESLPGPLRVRNWRPGDRFWPAHTKSPKKIKELLRVLHVAQPTRKSWPVVVSGDEIVWVRGFPSPAKLRPKPGRAAIVILDEALIEKSANEC